MAIKFIYRYLPETKELSVEQITEHYAHRLSRPRHTAGRIAAKFPGHLTCNNPYG